MGYMGLFTDRGSAPLVRSHEKCNKQGFCSTSSWDGFDIESCRAQFELVAGNLPAHVEAGEASEP